MPLDPKVVIERVQITLAPVRRQGHHHRTGFDAVAPGVNRRRYRGGRAADQQTFGARQNPAHGNGARLRHHLQRVNTVGIENRRALAGAQARNIATAGGSVESHRADAVHGNDFGGRMMALKMLKAAHQGAGGACADEQVIDMPEMLADRARRGACMGSWIGSVFILVEPYVTRIAADFFANQRDARAEETAIFVRRLNPDDLGAVSAHHANVVVGAVGIDHAGETNPAFGAEHGQRHTQVARRRFDQNRVRADQAA